MATGFHGLGGATGFTGPGASTTAVPGPVLPICPTGEFMDPLALFTHGEFPQFDHTCPELLLYTHGEFPRPVIRKGIKKGSTAPGGKRRRRVIYPEVIWETDEEDAIAAALLLLDDDDDWADWF